MLSAALEQLTRLEIPRSARLAAVGGGAVTDIGAFAASVYMRGVALTLVPTTLLAMVDAAIGGKTGIDYYGYKNLVGTFFPADSVLIVPEFLRSLPDREYLSGLAEVIKAAMLGDAELLRILESKTEAVLNRDPVVIDEIISRAVVVKSNVVNADFKETGQRAFLNLGHTFGHALEAVAGLGEKTHGEAVAWGIGRSLALGTRLGMTDTAWSDRVRALLDRFGYDLSVGGYRPEELIAAMRKDKKRRDERLMFVLQTGAQETTLEAVETVDVLAVLTSDE